MKCCESRKRIDQNSVEGVKKDVNKIFELMCQVFLLPSKSRKPGGLHSEDGEVENNESFPSIHVNEEDLKRLKDFRLLETSSWSLVLTSRFVS